MKYLTAELWAAKDAESEAQWIRNNKKYEEYLKGIEIFLPKEFMQHYEENQGFHDFTISSIEIEDTDKFNIVLEKKYLNKTFHISFYPITECSISMKNKESMICGKLGWGYCEFELLTVGQLKLSIICDGASEIAVVFEAGEKACEIIELQK